MRIINVVLTLIVFGLTLSGQQVPPSVPGADPFEAFRYRNLGAFRISAWVGSIAVPENPGPKHKYTFYVGPRSGGVWKTVNNGTTFECISDAIGSTSVGDIAVAPSNPEIVWTGTGETFNARSSYYGNGVWKSTDAGKTWQNMGLNNTHHISKVVIHPKNPDVVYVASMGGLFSEDENRGVFKTTDGGKSWNRVFFIDKATGIIDLALNRKNPDILYAAAYEKVRTAWTYEPGGMKSRIYKTTDGGVRWTMLKNGLPDVPLGRIGIDIHRANPDILVAVVQNLSLKPGVDPDKLPPFDVFTDRSLDNVIGGEVYKSFDAGKSWKRISDPAVDVSGKAAYSFNRIYIDPVDHNKIYIVGVGMFYTLDGGKTWPVGRNQDRFRTNFGDNRSFWINPDDPRHILLGSDGGIYSTWDGGLSMNHYYQLPLGEIYNVEVDNAEPYNIYIGLQDHETWKGPSNSWSGQVNLADWVIVGMWDGMYCRVDPEDNRWLYFTTQFGSHHRVDQLKGERVPIAPVPPAGADPYRYTWVTPLVLSPHNSSILYTGGEKLLRSFNRGDTWEEISPDLTDNDRVKIAGTGHIMYCTITTISESPVKPGVIWAGTDDGHVHITTNHGAEWYEATDNLTRLGAPADRWVMSVFASWHDAGTAYVAKNGFHNDDFNTYLYKTTDYGRSWTDISSDLPDSPVNVIFEDRKNPGLLFAGNDKGVFVSLTGGSKWQPLRSNMPPAVVRDLTVHPRENDLIVGTYGRAAWITDISPLQQFTAEVEAGDFFLFEVEPKPKMNYSQQASWGNYHMTGSNHLRTPNEPNGLEIWYYFRDNTPGGAILTITDSDGKEVFRREIKPATGISKLYWNTNRAIPGIYRVEMSFNGKSIIRKTEVRDGIFFPVLNFR
ncbi:MAG: hypothetical protein FJY11_00125 [Bacteroidetes bacterium]|nr:hypothetical protein [Bacteroidota bacterium]